MSSDAEALRAVMSWACGFLTLAILGAAIPLFLSFLPDAVHLWRRQGEPRPALVDLGLVVCLTLIAGYESTLTGAPGTPSTVLWLSLTLLLASGVGVGAFCFAASRALERRADQQRALEAATAPPTSSRDEVDSEGKPEPVHRLNARDAEYLARDWMRHLGATEATVTPEQRDGGVDVRSREYVAQVKHLRNEQVGVAAIRQLYGVASAEERRALFFSSSGYTRDALAFARENNIALFVVRHQQGRLVPHGALAQQHLAHGLNAVTQH